MRSINSMYCPKCGSELAVLGNGDRYCGCCKARYMVTHRTAAPIKQAGKNRSKGVVVILIALLVLLLGAIGGFLLYHFLFSR